MAQIIVRPIADISQTNVTYSSGTSAYPLINEVTADGDTTYIGWILAALGKLVVRCTSIDTSKIKTINTITLYVTYRGGGVGSTIGFGFSNPVTSGTTRSTGTSTTYVTASFVYSVNLPPSSFDLTNFQTYFEVTSAGSKDLTYLTQLYVVIDYTEKAVIYMKINNEWVQASAVYVKIDGTWKTVASIYDKISGVWRTG